MEPMKKSKAVLAAVCILQLACVSENARKVKLQIPGPSPINLADYAEVAITNFRVEKETPDLEINKEVVDALAFELGRGYKGKVAFRTVAWNRDGLIEDRAFWKGLGAGSEKTLFLTGGVRYTQEIRKAIIDADTKEIDGPFKTVNKGLAERRIFNLVLDLCLIRADTGEIVFRKEYKETRTFPNPNQPFSFAFYELLPRIKKKFFRTILAEERGQERYLILK
jgi:hypothetical protein